MNQRFGFIMFSTLMMTALAVPLSGSRVFAGQEKSAAGDGAQSKPSTSTVKPDPNQSTPPTASPQDPTDQTKTWGPYDIYSSFEFGVRGIGINGNGNKF